MTGLEAIARDLIPPVGATMAIAVVDDDLKHRAAWLIDGRRKSAPVGPAYDRPRDAIALVNYLNGERRGEPVGWKEERNAELIARRNAGEKLADLAAEFGISEARVSYIANHPDPIGRPVELPRREVAERLWAKVDRSGGPDACWPWTGATVNGYGHIYVPGRDMAKTHRLSLEIALDRELGPDEMACHTCDNRPCCNPGHLYAGDASTNAQDMLARGRHNSQTRPASRSTPQPDLAVDVLGDVDAGSSRAAASIEAPVTAASTTPATVQTVGARVQSGQGSSRLCPGCGGPTPPGRRGQDRKTCSSRCRRAVARAAHAATPVDADVGATTSVVTPSRPSAAASSVPTTRAGVARDVLPTPARVAGPAFPEEPDPSLGL